MLFTASTIGVDIASSGQDELLLICIKTQIKHSFYYYLFRHNTIYEFLYYHTFLSNFIKFETPLHYSLPHAVL